VSEADEALAALRQRFPLGPEEWADLIGADPLLVARSGDRVAIGLNVFAPGEVFSNHLHARMTETFVGVSGEIDLWLDRSTLHRLTPGEIVSVPPGVEHALSNRGGEPAMLLYVKSPAALDDRIEAVWTLPD
jgi:quercetin dioxygenase-like cupin family protein